ncbi:MAG TPA: TonB-dependent receptor [Gemmatimonadaceae bacterium]|nr:TonB-dependent receptor [Gemmatimonadaceae bacterium]
MHACRRLATHGVILGMAAFTALVPHTGAAQGGTGIVRGKVTSTASGAPVQGAQVVIFGTRIGAVSAADGSYSINRVPAGAQVIRFRAIGFAQADRPVSVVDGITVTLDVALGEAVVALDEVVVTGTAGSARKREVGNSISAIKVADVPDVPTSVSNLLSGKLAGVNVTGASGNSGAGQAVRLRGMTSVALTNQPLIYIDGVRVRSDEYPKNVSAQPGQDLRSNHVNASPLNDINPEDIDRMEVVMGAAAATLYGTDAAAGVIQIFTKRGAPGAAKWQAQLTSAVNHMQPFGYGNVKADPNCFSSCATSQYLYMEPYLRDGRRNGAAVQVSGGTINNTRYFVSMNADNNDGVLPNDGDKKYAIRANIDFTPLKDLAVSWNSSYTNDALSNTPAGNNAAGLTLNAFRRDRNYFGNDSASVIRQVLSFQLNSYIDRLILGTTGTWTPLRWFSSRLTLGLDRAAVENRNYRPYGFVSAPQGILSDQRWQNRTVSLDWSSNVELSFPGSVNSTFSFGTQYVNSEVSDAQAYGEGFAGPGSPTVSSASLKNAFENRQTVITGGAFVQELLGWKDRYFLTAGIRIDGNSAFGTNFGLQKYPKVSASWVASDEKWWRWHSATVKMRAAYGEAGRAPGAFDAVQTWSAIGWGGQAAFRPLNVGNPDLGPERTKETELGFDATAFDGRLNLTYTYYDARTSDALFPVRLDPSNGFQGSQLQNVGKLAKNGMELSLGGTILERKNLGLTASVSVSTNHSEVLSLGGVPAFSIGNFGWVIQGQQVPMLRGRLIRNRFELGAQPDTVPNYLFGPSQPTRIIGGTIAVSTWRKISVTLRGEYQGGGWINESASFNALSRSVKWPTCFKAYDALAANQPISAWDRATCIAANAKSDMFIFPADFFKLRDLTVTVPLGSLIPGTTSSMFVVTAQNFYRRTYGMAMFDPEQSGNDGFNAPVRYISEHIPAPATYLASLRISF